MTFKIRYIFLVIFLFFLACLFWPKMIIVYYDNPDDPIMVSLTQYDDTKIRKDLKSGMRIFRLKQGYTRWSKDIAYLDWYQNKSKKDSTIHGNPNFPEVIDTLDLRVCRGNIYINKDGSVQKSRIDVSRIYEFVFMMLT